MTSIVRRLVKRVGMRKSDDEHDGSAESKHGCSDTQP